MTYTRYKDGKIIPPHKRKAYARFMAKKRASALDYLASLDVADTDEPSEDDDRFDDVGYGSRPFRAETGPSHLPTAEEVAGRYALWLEAVSSP